MKSWLGLALFFAATLSSGGTAALSPTVFTQPGPLAVKPDDDFLIALASNPSTGYRWSATVSGSKAVTAKGSAYQSRAPGMPGAGGQQVFSFQAGHAGTATISLAYARPWEKNVKPIKQLFFTVSAAK